MGVSLLLRPESYYPLISLVCRSISQQEDTVSFIEHENKVKENLGKIKQIREILIQSEIYLFNLYNLNMHFCIIEENVNLFLLAIQLGICITIGFIIFVAVVVTTLKIILYDRETYPGVFGITKQELEGMKNINVRLPFYLSSDKNFLSLDNKLDSYRVLTTIFLN